MNRITETIKSMMPNHTDQTDIKYFKIIMYSFIGIILITFVAGAITFLMSLRGAEDTLVPEVRGEEIVEALVELQRRELYPRVEARFDSDPATRGTILEQSPAAGSVVKAGQRVQLIVSQGAIVDRVDDYMGRPVEEVRDELLALFSTFDALVRIANVTYVFHPSDPGIIVEQDPAPGVELSGPTDLNLIVSRGARDEPIRASAYVGLQYTEALQRIGRVGIPFEFVLIEPAPGRTPGVIQRQQPVAGSELEDGESLVLELVPPQNVPEGLVFGVFRHELPRYPVAVELNLDVLSPTGERRRLASMLHPGGTVTVPYLEELGSTLVLSRYTTELTRTVVADSE